jgi:SAM-dependent methyltransferase
MNGSREEPEVPGIDYDSIASLYDTYVTADYDVPFFVAEVRRVQGPVLELTSGTGRLSVPLVEAGANLTCVDCSQGMLDVLSSKLADRGLQADVCCADLCHLDLTPRFELAILPFQSFMEIVGEQRQRGALAAVHTCLKPGGRFICTLHNPAVRRTQVDGTLRLVGRFPLKGGDLVVSGFEQGGQPVVARLQFFEFFAPDGILVWKRLLAMEFEFVEHEAFEKMARDAGFQVVQFYGDYKRGRFDAAGSPVMIFVLEKAAK